MKEYIINPSWFYWISVAETARIVLCVIFGCLLVSCVIMWPLLLTTWTGDEDDIRKRKTLIVFSVLAVVTGLAAMFIPSRDTLVEMQIARLATPENAAWTVDKLKEAVDYIVDAIKAVK